MSAKVLWFPIPVPAQNKAPDPVMVWFRCQGGCGTLVTSWPAWCLNCAVEEQ